MNMELYITCDKAGKVLDLTSHLANVGQAAKDALAAGGKQYVLSGEDTQKSVLAAAWPGDHWDGGKLTEDSPQRPVVAADQAALAVDLATLEMAKTSPDATTAAIVRTVLRLA